MERAAGLAAARNISWELYYHNCTSGVKCEVLKAVSQSSTTRFIGTPELLRSIPS
jgi:hypothetical protein